MIGVYPREPWHGVAFGPAIAIASIAATALSAGVSMMGSMREGEAAQESANYQAAVAQQNQTIAQQNAEYATAAGNAQAAKVELQNKAQTGAIKAAEAATSLDVNSGSPLDVQSSQKLLGEMNVATIRNQAAWRSYGAATQATSFGAQAGLDTAQGAASASAGTIGAVGSLLSGASSVGSNLLTFKRYGVLSNAPQGLSVGG